MCVLAISINYYDQNFDEARDDVMWHDQIKHVITDLRLCTWL